MSCPYLAYRSPPENTDGTPRAYCEVVERFVQPMRADICNDRYALDHETHCEIYLEEVGSDS